MIHSWCTVVLFNNLVDKLTFRLKGHPNILITVCAQLCRAKIQYQTFKKQHDVMQKVPKWSDTLWKSERIYKSLAALAILRRYVLTVQKQPPRRAV